MSRVYSDKKQKYAEKLRNYLQTYTAIILVIADNVGSNQIQQIRAAIRGRGEILMGKNTQIRRVIREVAAEEGFEDLNNLLPHIFENIGMVFTNESIKEIGDIVCSFRIPAAAKVGIIAQCDVFVPPGPTGLDPGQTAFFQSLSIPTKIARGSIEILSEVHLIKKGDKVGNSETALLAKLNIRPFSYGFVMRTIYDMGSVYDPAVLQMTQNDLFRKFFAGVAAVASIGLALGLPNRASMPHSLINSFKKCVAIAVETGYNFKQADAIKAYLADPAAFANDEVKESGDHGNKGAASPEALVKSDSEEEVGGGGGLLGSESEEESD